MPWRAYIEQTLERRSTREKVRSAPPGLIIAQAQSGAGLAKQEREESKGSSFAQYERQGVVLPNHTSYLLFFLHRQNFWRIKFTPKNA